MAVIMSYHGNLESRAALVEAVNLAKRLDENCCAYMPKSIAATIWLWTAR